MQKENLQHGKLAFRATATSRLGVGVLESWRYPGGAKYVVNGSQRVNFPTLQWLCMREVVACASSIPWLRKLHI